MKWMGGWSEADLYDASPETVAEIRLMIEEEAEERQQQMDEMESRRG